MPTRPWPRRLVRTTILSATLAAVCSAQDRAAVLRQATANYSPDITGGPFTLWSQNEDATFSSGTYLGVLIYSANYSDPDDINGSGPWGLAIVGADTANGSWEYTTDGTSTWTAFGAVSPSNALLLDFVAGQYGGTGVRFVPNQDYNGTLPTALTFRAWDETVGTPSGMSNPQYANVSSTGGGSAFGATLETASLVVNPVNDAPRLDISGAPYLNPETYNTPGDPGTSISVMLGRGAPVVDPDTDAPIYRGVALIGADTTYGTWEYMVDGSTWQAMPALSPTSALVLNSGAYIYGYSTDVRVRFVQTDSSFTGTITNALTYRAWDQGDWSYAGSVVDPTFYIGDPYYYSVNAETASIAVTGLTTPIADIVFPEPPVSSGSDTVYGAVSSGTPEGLMSLEAALNGKSVSETRAFSWDALTQAFVEYPSQPTAGLHPDTGIFLATRVPLSVNFSGSISAMPYVLTLQPGWNLVGVPPLDNSGSIVLSHPWDDFLLVDNTATPVTSDPTFTDVLGTPGGPTSSARPWLWDGAGYSQVTTLETGKAYWIKNNAASTYTLQRTSGSQTPLPRLVGATPRASGGQGPFIDRGSPPAPPSGRAKATGGCGAGSVVALIALGLIGALRGISIGFGRRRR